MPSLAHLPSFKSTLEEIFHKYHLIFIGIECCQLNESIMQWDGTEG